MEFSKELFADLLQQAKGDRSINRFGSEADVDPGYLSRLLRCCVETPPSAAVLAKIAVKAANNVTIEQLLWASGYINWPSLDIVVGDDNGRAPLLDPTGGPPRSRSTAPRPYTPHSFLRIRATPDPNGMRSTRPGVSPDTEEAGAPRGRRPDTADLKQAVPDPAVPWQSDRLSGPRPQAGTRALEQRGIAGSGDYRAPSKAGPHDSGANPDVNADDDSMVEELLSFCKEMMDRPILQDVFNQMKDLSDDKLRRVLKMIKMIDL